MGATREICNWDELYPTHDFTSYVDEVIADLPGLSDDARRTITITYREALQAQLAKDGIFFCAWEEIFTTSEDNQAADSDLITIINEALDTVSLEKIALDVTKQ